MNVALGWFKKLASWVVMAVLIAAVVTTFTLAVSRKESANRAGQMGDIEDSFYQSLGYDPGTGLLSFTIPQQIPRGYKFYLHVSGRATWIISSWFSAWLIRTTGDSCMT